MTFERYRIADAQKRRDDAQLSVYSDPTARVNKAGVRQHFDGAGPVAVYVDHDRGVLAFDPDIDPDETDTLTLSSGGEISTTAVLKWLGVDVEQLDETHHFPLDKDPDTGYIVADVSDLLGVDVQSEYHDDIQEVSNADDGNGG